MAKITTNLKRILKYGLLGFIRNGFVSLATVLVMTISLFIIASSMYADAALKNVLNSLKEQVDINVYFVPGADDKKINAVYEDIKQLPEVKEVSKVSADAVLAQFKERHKDDQLTLQSIEELGDNPFGAMLQIRAKDPSQYEVIAKYINTSQQDNEIIENVNFLDVKGAINTLSSLINASKKIALVVISFLIFISILIVFITIRLAVYTSKEEISVMKLVGATDWYVQGPFIAEGGLYGLLAGVLTMLILYPLSLWLSEPSRAFLMSFDTMRYYVENFANLTLMVVGIGILLGVVSSYLSVRRYLDV